MKQKNVKLNKVGNNFKISSVTNFDIIIFHFDISILN